MDSTFQNYLVIKPLSNYVHRQTMDIGTKSSHLGPWTTRFFPNTMKERKVNDYRHCQHY
jgi:hypothetical protein